jgi:hypothetical protein
MHLLYNNNLPRKRHGAPGLSRVVHSSEATNEIAGAIDSNTQRRCTALGPFRIYLGSRTNSKRRLLGQRLSGHDRLGLDAMMLACE